MDALISDTIPQIEEVINHLSNSIKKLEALKTKLETRDFHDPKSKKYHEYHNVYFNLHWDHDGSGYAVIDGNKISEMCYADENLQKIFKLISQQD